MTDINDTTAAQKSAARVADHANSIRAAFDSLGLGWGFDEITEYMTPQTTGIDLPADQFGRLIGVCMAFAMICVERDRESRPSDAARLRSQLAAIHRFTIDALGAEA